MRRQPHRIAVCTRLREQQSTAAAILRRWRQGQIRHANLESGFGEFSNSDEVNFLYRRIVSRRYVDLILIETNFATDHVGTDNPSFEDAVVRIFK